MNLARTAGNTAVPVFENSIDLMKASEFCSRFGYSMKTIYEWRYRPKRNKVPTDLVVKFRGKLFIRTDILKSLVVSTGRTAQAALQEE
jgi:hypothetical protein